VRITIKNISKQLSEREKHFQVIFEQAAVGVALVNSLSGKFLRVNRKFCNIVGYSEEEMLDMDFQSITHPEDLHNSLDYMELLNSLKIREINTEKRYVHKNGNIVWVYVTVSPVWDSVDQPGYNITIIQDITERKCMEEELAKSRAILIKAQEIGHLGSWEWDIATNDIVWSKEVYKLYGLDTGIGTPKFENILNTLAPESKNDFLKDVDNALKWYKPLDMEYTIICPDGSRRCIHKKGKVVYDREGHPIKMYGMVQDITERKRVEESLKEVINKALTEKSKTEAIIAALGDGIIIQDTDYNILYQNHIQTKIYGEHNGELCYRVYAGRDTVCEDRPVERTFRDGNIHKSERAVQTGSGIFYFELTSSPLRDPEGNIIAGVKIVRDITMNKRAEEERAQLIKREHKALAEAEAARKLERMKSLFIASTSHELRTPLNSIIGFTGILIQGWSGELNQEQKEQLEIVNSSARHLLALITDVIDLSKIEAGKICLEVSEFDLSQVVDEAILTLNANRKEKGLEVIVDVEDIQMRTDRTRLLQCVINLLSNAIKFTEKGSVKITARIIQNKVDISVTDTGIGIKNEDIPKLFAPFVRLESPLTVKTEGTGLGLYITKKLARDILEGDLVVNSEYGSGSVFTLHIPVDLSGKI
jgi:PAS domain S-box-containing protein